MAWNDIARVEHRRKSRRYPSDMTDEEWALLAPLLPPSNAAGDRVRPIFGMYWTPSCT
jgi:putative transposase